MLGRLRTASRPSSTVMEDAPYSFFFVVTGLLVAPALAHGPTLGRGPPPGEHHPATGRAGTPTARCIGRCPPPRTARAPSRADRGSAPIRQRRPQGPLRREPSRVYRLGGAEEARRGTCGCRGVTIRQTR